MKIFLHEPVLVSQAPPSVRGWGPWQFPLLLKQTDGRILLEFHKEADSARAYGLPGGQMQSSDGGQTWEEVPAPGITAGLNLPDGSELRAVAKPSIPTAGLDLPEPLAHVPSSYEISYTYYRRQALPPALQSGWWFRRRAAGSNEWIEQQARVDLPDPWLYATEGVFVFPFFEQNRIHLTAEGQLLATLYGQPQVSRGRLLVRRFLSMLLASHDSGRSWQVKSVIPYQPDRRADPEWDARDGFSEPQITMLPGGEMLAFLRTTDGSGVGPLYWTRSRDGGSTWENPRVFDRFGVWPQALVLSNGAILAAYGRPGLFLRAAADPRAMHWGRRITLVPPGDLGHDTCSYCSLLALTDSTALVAYSDFNVPDDQGRPCKTILVRRIECSP